MPGLAMECQVCKNLTHHRRKLKPMPRESGSDGDLLEIGMNADHKVSVLRECVHAGLRFDHRPIKARNKFAICDLKTFRSSGVTSRLIV